MMPFNGDKRVKKHSILIDTCFIHKTMKLPAVFNELKRRRLQMAIEGMRVTRLSVYAAPEAEEEQ
jgi:hypothetical protein